MAHTENYIIKAHLGVTIDNLVYIGDLISRSS